MNELNYVSFQGISWDYIFLIAVDLVLNDK